MGSTLSIPPGRRLVFPVAPGRLSRCAGAQGRSRSADSPARGSPVTSPPGQAGVRRQSAAKPRVAEEAFLMALKAGPAGAPCERWWLSAVADGPGDHSARKLSATLPRCGSTIRVAMDRGEAIVWCWRSRAGDRGAGGLEVERAILRPG